MDGIKVLRERLLPFLLDDCQPGLVHKFQPRLPRPCPRTVLLVKVRHLGTAHVLLDEDEAAVGEAELAATEERDEVVIAEVTEYPLAPDSVVTAGRRHELVQAAADVAVDAARLCADVPRRFVEERRVHVHHVHLSCSN